MPEKARRGSQNSLKGVKRSHLAAPEPSIRVLHALRGCPWHMHSTAPRVAGNMPHACMHACSKWRFPFICICRQPGVCAPEVHGPGPLEHHLVRPSLPDLVHLEDGREEQAQEGDVELVPCMRRIDLSVAWLICSYVCPGSQGLAGHQSWHCTNCLAMQVELHYWDRPCDRGAPRKKVKRLMGSLKNMLRSKWSRSRMSLNTRGKSARAKSMCSCGSDCRDDAGARMHAWHGCVHAAPQLAPASACRIHRS